MAGGGRRSAAIRTLPLAGDTARPSVLHNIASALDLRHEHFGDQADPNEAIAAIRAAVAPEITERVYDELASHGTTGTAQALHDAVNALRAGRRTKLAALWAPYIHIGP